MATSSIERRRLNKRNAEIVAFIEALPIGEHRIFVETPSIVLLKREGCFAFGSKNNTDITILETR